MRLPVVLLMAAAGLAWLAAYKPSPRPIGAVRDLEMIGTSE